MSINKDPVFARNLKEIRERKGISQKKMADLLGLGSQPAYQRYESGVVPSHRILYSMADKLEVSAADLLSENPASPATDVASIDLHPKIQAQAEALMDEEGFTEMKELVTYLVKEETKRRGGAEKPAPESLDESMGGLSDSMKEMREGFDKSFGKD